MNTVQEAIPTAAFPPPCPFPDLQAQDRSKDSTHDNVCPDPAALDTNVLPARCQFADPIRIGVPSGEPERGISPEPLPDRCQFTFSDGRQCRMPRSEIHPSLCRYHAEREEQLFGEPGHSCVVGAALDLPELYSACRDLSTAAGVNRALAQVFRLLALRRISRQEAATFGHLAQLLLRSILAGESHGHQELSPDNKVAQPAPYRQAGAVILSDQPERRISPELSHEHQNGALPRQPASSTVHPLPPPMAVPPNLGIFPVSPPVSNVEPERSSDFEPQMPSWRMAPDSSPVGAPVGRAKVYPPPRKGDPQDALFAGNKGELLRVNKVQDAPAPNLQGPQNQQLHEMHLQVTRNEDLPNCST